jgi:hypothetical protein
MPEAATSASTSRVLLVDAGQAVDIFELVEVGETVARVRTAYLFELGEELRLRVENGGASFETTARVRAHNGSGDDRITELELGDRVTAG